MQLSIVPASSRRAPLARFALLLAALSVSLVLPATSVSIHAAPPELTLDELLERFDRGQASIQTLSASFTETTHNALLVDPIVSEGRFFMTKPASIRWEYSAPEEMRFIIASDQYTGYFPKRNRAEQRNIKRYSERIFRFIGLGQGSAELKNFYSIRLGTPEELADAPAGDDRYLLVLEPNKRRVKKRVAQVRFWIDAKQYLPQRVEYLAKNGDQRVIEFEDVQLNPDLKAQIYSAELPEGVTITEGFSGLAGVNAVDEQD